MKALRFILPLALFVVLVGFLWVGLSRDPHEVPSPLVDKPAPAFSLARLDDPAKKLARQIWMRMVPGLSAERHTCGA